MALLYKGTLLILFIAPIFQLSKSLTTMWSPCLSSVGKSSEVVSGVDGKKVNLNVSCDKDVANLNWNTGGLVVTSVRLAQECVVQGGQNDSTPLSELLRILSLATSSKAGQKHNVTPSFDLLLQPRQLQESESELKCYYFGCCVADQYVHRSRYFFTFNTVTCTFKQTRALETTSVKSFHTSFAKSIPMSSSAISHNQNQNETSDPISRNSGNGEHLMWIIIAALLAAIIVAVIISTACFLICRKRTSKDISMGAAPDLFSEKQVEEDTF